MADPTKLAKKMIVVSFKEIPEYISVQSKVINKATALLKKYENMYYAAPNAQGLIEFTKIETSVNNKQTQSLRAVRPMSQTVKTNLPSGPKTITFNPVIPSNVNAQSFVSPSASVPAVPFKALPMPLNVDQYSTTNLTNLAPLNNTIPMPIPTLTLPFANSVFAPSAVGTASLVNTSVGTKETACMTEPQPMVINQREQLTPQRTLASIAIQCSIEDSVEELEIVEENNLIPNDAVELTEEEKKQEFLQYVRENSTEYSNKMKECLICGEICKSLKYFYGHMAVHRGPKCLCNICGRQLENESLLKSHFCVGTKRENRALLRCPERGCTVVAVSPLEYYDHINEHGRFRMHKCSVCRKSFCTAQELLGHLSLRKKCFTNAKRYRSLVYRLKTRTERRYRVRVFMLHTHSKKKVLAKRSLAKHHNAKNLCELCFLSFRRKYFYHRHVKRCRESLRKWTSRKNRRETINEM